MQALNYSTQAIPRLHNFADLVSRRGSNRSAEMVRSIVAIIEASHKFRLPAGGKLFDGTVTEKMLPVFRLPFPQIVIEFESSPDSVKRVLFDGKTFVREKHIVVCFETHEGTVIWPIAYQLNDWEPSWIARLVPHDFAHWNDVKYGLTLEGRWLFLGEEANRCAELLNRSDEAFAETSWSAITEELTSAFQLCAALQCRNVSTERLDPPVKLQAKRAKEGKLPLFSYHILTVGNANPTAHTGAPGSHSSPRTHLRRGHIRNHPTAGFVWVQSCVVNPGARGSVNKDYAVTSRRAVLEALNGHA